MMRLIALLTANDLAVAFKNKTVYLLTFIPLFVWFSLSVVDRSATQPALRLGLVQHADYPEGLTDAVQPADGGAKLFTVRWFGGVAAARAQLASGELDGVVLPAASDEDSATLLVAEQQSAKTMRILAQLTALQAAADERPPWVGELQALSPPRAIEQHTLPIWLLMLILLVGFLVVPPQVAEDKEKRWLLGLLQTPVRESHWLAAKVLTGMLLTLASTLLLQALNQLWIEPFASYLALLVAGSFCFSSLGVLLGSLCRTQASARAFGVILYLPHLLPSALAEFSSKLHHVAPLLPSYQLFKPLRSLVLGGDPALPLTWPLIYLLTTGVVSCLAAHALIKRRWQMPA